jgi:hypothetical protein
MALKQFYTKTRPDTSVPFFEDAPEYLERTEAVLKLIEDHPELVIGRETDPGPATGLVWTGNWTYPGVEEFREFSELINEIDAWYRSDRIAYYQLHNHEMLIEYQLDGMEERGLISRITPDKHTVRTSDGTVVEVPKVTV